MDDNQRLGDYEVRKELGRGATAIAYLGQHVESDQQVCLKVFHPTLWQEGSGGKRIQREIDLTKKLKHPNIVRVREVLATDPPTLVMDYVEGQNLERFQSQLPYVFPEVSVCIAIEVLKALEYAHDLGVVHRDIKPENILIERKGQVFVTDFGHAKVRDATLGTQPNALMGSLDYMSPEQARGDQVGPLSDVFSVGTLLYFLTTGTRPFTRAGAAATLIAIREETPESPAKRNPKISADLTRLLLKALAKDPKARFQSAKEFRLALQQYLTNLDLGEFSLSLWLADPSKETISGLATATEQLITQAQAQLQRGERSLFLETLAHLSLKAPESPAISRLSQDFESANHKTRRKSALFWLSTGTGLLLFLLLLYWGLFWSPSLPPSPESPTPAPVVSAPAPPEQPLRAPVVTKTPPPTEQPSVPSPKKVRATAAPLAQGKQIPRKPRPASPAPKKVPTGTVRFEVARDIRVFWNGKEVNPNSTLRGQRLGTHELRLERAGFDPIRSKVTVKVGQPTVIRVK